MPFTKALTKSSKNNPISVYAEIRDPTQPLGKKRVNIEDLLNPDTTERIRAGTATKAHLSDRGKSDTQKESQDQRLTKEKRIPRVTGAELHSRLKTIRTNQDETSNGAKYSMPMRQYLLTSTERTRARVNKPSVHFVAPGQVEREEWRCSRFERNVRKIAHPGGATKTVQKPCGKREGCVGYAMDLKILRYLASSWVELQTVLRFMAPNPFEAWEFRQNAQHNRRAQTRRISLLHQNTSEKTRMGQTSRRTAS